MDCWVTDVNPFRPNHIGGGRMTRVLEGNTTQYSTIAAVANIDNRKDSSLSMGTGMDN